MLTGKANPSGKLPFTWPVRLEDVAAHALNAYPGVWRADHKVIDEEYKEGLYVGYRWVDKQKVRPLFAFGHGLSYTTFSLNDLKAVSPRMAATDSTLTFTIRVTNTGKVAGAEVVQLYLHDGASTIDRPTKELKAFAKVELQPGESKVVPLTINRRAVLLGHHGARLEVHPWQLHRLCRNGI